MIIVRYDTRITALRSRFCWVLHFFVIVLVSVVRLIYLFILSLLLLRVVMLSCVTPANVVMLSFVMMSVLKILEC